MPRKRLAAFNVTSSEELYKLAPKHPDAMLVLFRRHDKISCDYQQKLFDIAYVKICNILFSDEARNWLVILDNCIVNGSGSVLHKFGCMILKDALFKLRSAVAVAEAVENRLTKLNNDTQNKDIVNLGIEAFHIPLFSLFLKTCTDEQVKTLILDLYNNWDRISHPEQILMPALDSKPELVEFAFNQVMIKLNSSLWNDNKVALKILFNLAPKYPDYVTEDLYQTVQAKGTAMNAEGREESIRVLGAFAKAKTSLSKRVFEQSELMLKNDDDHSVHNAAINTIAIVAEVNPEIVKPAFNIVLRQFTDRRDEVRTRALNVIEKILTDNQELLTNTVFSEIINLAFDNKANVSNSALRIITTLIQIKPTLLSENTFKFLLNILKNHSNFMRQTTATNLLTILIPVKPTSVTSEYFNAIVRNVQSNNDGLIQESFYALTAYAKTKEEMTQEAIEILINEIDCWASFKSLHACKCLSILIPLQPCLVNEKLIQKMLKTFTNDVLNNNFYGTNALIACVKAKPEFLQFVLDGLIRNYYVDKGADRSYTAYVFCLIMKEDKKIYIRVLNAIRDELKFYMTAARESVIRSFEELADISPSVVIPVAINALIDLLNKNKDYADITALKTLTNLVTRNPELITQAAFDAAKAKLNDRDMQKREAAFEACSTFLTLNNSLTYSGKESAENYIEEKLIAFYFEGLSAARANLNLQVMNNNTHTKLNLGSL